MTRSSLPSTLPPLTGPQAQELEPTRGSLEGAGGGVVLAGPWWLDLDVGGRAVALSGSSAVVGVAWQQGCSDLAGWWMDPVYAEGRSMDGRRPVKIHLLARCHGPGRRCRMSRLGLGGAAPFHAEVDGAG